MLPRKTRHSYYALLLVLVSIVFSSAVAKTKVYKVLSEVVSSSAEVISEEDHIADHVEKAVVLGAENIAPSMMFMTIIQGADEEVGCSNNGFTVARFNLCGDSDDRTITLSGGPYGSVQWQILGGSCSPDINEDCPNTTTSCYTTVGTAQSFNLDASTIPAGSGSEFRVVADGQQYFFKVKKSTITQTYVKRDYICGVDGRIQITNLSSAYEFSIDGGSGFGAWQTSPIFDGLAPGTYIVKARLQNTPNTCEYPYEPIVIEQLDIGIDVEFTDAQCFGDTGSITVTVNDVPGPYKYTLLDENGVPQEFTTFISTNPYTFSAVGFGTYSVQVETQQCTGDPGNGIPPPQQSLDINGNPIVIGDGIVPLTASTEVNESLSSEPGCGSPNVDIILRTSGGTPPYTFTVNGSPGGTFNPPQTIHTVNTADTYDFVVTDANGCTITASANVQELTPPDVTVSGIDGTCTNGGARLDITVVDAKGYNLSFRATPTDPWSTDPLLSVAAGTYNSIQVRYEQGGFSCFITLPDSITVTETGAINGADPTWTDMSCNGSGGIDNGSITFPGAYSGAGGGPYEFSINGSDFFSQQVFNNLPAGTYTPAVRNASGCRRDFTAVTIAGVDPPTNIDFVQSNTNCAANTSDVQLTATANFAIATYEVISPTSINNGANDTFIGLTNNISHTFRITDVNGCIYEESFTPAVISTIRARVKSGGDLNVCTGASDGNGTFIIDGFANNYTYNINGGTESAPQNDAEVDITGLAVGSYTITVTDADTGCQDTATLTVQEPATPLSLTPTVTDMSCANNNIGRVVANASGGFGTYRYELDWPTPPGITQGPKSGNVFGNLTAEGTYTLRVTDAEGCTATTTFTLSVVDAPTIALGAVDYCFSPTNDGSITVSSTAGTAPIGTHQYRINGGTLQASPTFAGLVPGTYTVEVVDGNNCTDQLQVTIPPQIQIDLDLITEIPCGGNGEMQITVSGGDISNLASTSYTIYLNGAPVAGHIGLPLPLNPFNYIVPLGSDGDYTVEVTDNNGCTNTSPPLTFSPPVSISATENVVGPSCGDASSGYVEIVPDVTSGTPPFQIAFAPGGTGLIDDPFNPDPMGVYNYTSQTIYSGLPAGTYEYIVKDARNCTTGVRTVTINPDLTNPPDATVAPIDATCSATVLSGGIRITGITDGVPDFTIIIEDNFGNEFVRRENVTLADLPLDIIDPSLIEGNYTVITLDSRGCIDQDAVSINSSDLDIVPDPTTPLVCDRGNLPQCVDIVGGVGPFEIRLVTDPPSAFVSPNSGARRHCFANLVPGASYTVEVFDTTTNCTAIETIDIPDGPNPLNVALSIDNGNCNGEDVELDYTITGATGPTFDIEIRNLDTGAVIVSTTTSNTTDTFLVPQGPYAISVIDNGNDCTGGDTIEATLNMPRVDVIDNQNANCNELGQLTVRGSGGTPFPPSGPGSLPDGSPYEYAFVNSGSTPTYPADYGTATTVYLAGSLAPGTAYDIWVRDSRGCEYMTSATIVQLDPDLPNPIISVNNQCDVTPPVGGFQIDLEMPANVDNPTFTLGGQTQTPVYDPSLPTVASFNVPSVGVYDVYVIDANGCDVTTTAEVYQLLSASGGFSTDPTCEDADGTITINANGGSGDFTYRLTGTDFNANPVDITDPNADGIFENIAPGNYQVQVTDNLVTDGTNNCTTTVSSIISTAPVQPVIADTGESNISCNAADDGSINVVLNPGTDIDGIQEFNLYSATLPLSGTETPIATNVSGSFVGLSPGTYVVQVITDRLCTDVAEVTLTEPPIFEITASDETLTCENGTNRFSTATISAQIVSVGNGGPYGYRIDPNDSYQSSPDFDIVDNGADQTITIYAIDANGCEDDVTVTVFAPTDVVPGISTLNTLTCADPERVEITVTGTSDFTVITSGPSGTTVNNVTVTGGSTATVELPDPGDYLIEVQDDGPNGCSYPLPSYTVNAPVYPTVTVSEANPALCYGDANGAMFIEVTDYSGVYNYEAFLLDVNGNRVLPAQTTGSFDTANFPDVNGDHARITGLVGGNYEVTITTSANPQCPGTSNVTTVRAPNGPLVPDAIEIGNVSCNDNNGVIEANLNGGWDYAPYEYRLLFDSDNDSTYETEVQTWGNNNRFENLSSGDYRVEFRDVEGCSVTYDITLDSIVPIQAGIREPQGLVCPDGNNAVLEAYDPTTGDAITAIAGATGGVPGAGYKYQLIYLGSNNIADEISRSGLQDSPTFTGASGGFISQGWYAIEVSSSFGCIGVTIPYYVDPPPPIIPNLVQVQAPGCGGMGEMRLSIENPEPGFEYEYRPVGSLPSDPFTSMGLGNTSALITGGPGFYQFEVRKVNATNTCGVINSNGLTLVDAQNVDLVVNLPDDISCANETDGRIESFSSGGVGLNTYTLYIGDPIDAFSPSPTATVIASNDFGTFEGLDESPDYYVAVTSGTTCQDIEGPFEVARPAPIVYTAAATPVSCSEEDDGTITVEVTSGGIGLIQFAIGPNFNEFFSDPSTPGSYTFEDLEGDVNGRDYTILIQDSEGCSETAVIQVFEPEEIAISSVETPEICLGFADGTVQLTVTGGTPFVDGMGVEYYEVSMNSSDDVDFARNDSLFFDNLLGGESYAFFVRDANGCLANIVVPIEIGVDINAEPVVEYGCEGIFPNSTTTIVELNGSSFSDVLFSLDVDDVSLADTQRTWADLPPGDHTVYLYHPNGCTTFVEFTIDAYEPLVLEAMKTGPDEITAIATGGFGDYEFFFDGTSQGSDNIFNVSYDTTINIRVEDSMGCYAQIVFPFDFDGMVEFPNFFTPDGDNMNDSWFPRNREFFPNIEVIIYDRYGRVVARLDQVKEWDGNYDGKPLPTGDYWYVVNANDNEKQQYVGHFTLYR
ncbi:T9SS type B sorting domain-containing protein [Allomuricauda sp. SCSIO 65647]|uniref:T9SS type B sorting domain-containing protein n=1 Tax=Allomuricauda sp. SCSIO 65647 TaxID=2908843 RepID=UPI001F2D9C2C|nr:T9SS type B sorting domain-containing protein [Muricauda sp. SCSIO 65647]UJH67867.1 T9SS type B sorting domain-containing protein [Muricauda sp. SCSIO 65647]